MSQAVKASQIGMQLGLAKFVQVKSWTKREKTNECVGVRDRHSLQAGGKLELMGFFSGYCC